MLESLFEWTSFTWDAMPNMTTAGTYFRCRHVTIL